MSMVASCSAEKKLVRSAELSKKLSKDEYKTEYGVYVSQLRIWSLFRVEWFYTGSAIGEFQAIVSHKQPHCTWTFTNNFSVVEVVFVPCSMWTAECSSREQKESECIKWKSSKNEHSQRNLISSKCRHHPVSGETENKILLASPWFWWLEVVSNLFLSRHSLSDITFARPLTPSPSNPHLTRSTSALTKQRNQNIRTKGIWKFNRRCFAILCLRVF